MTKDPCVGAPIAWVRPGSHARRLGLRPGDRIVEVGDRLVEDTLAATFALGASVPPLTLRVRGPLGERTFTIRSPDSFLRGIAFEPLEPRQCSNDCLYCFCKQNPPGVRPSLLCRDEDFRLSFLAGTYLTLSDLRDHELVRIVRDRLSPLYVTVPSTNETIRLMMLGVRRARPLMDTLRTLVQDGITVYAQVVVCPGLNDGPHLERTLQDLSRLRPGVAGVALVPVGTTRFTSDPRIRRPTREELAALCAVARRWRVSAGGGVPFVHASDEVYLGCGLPLPSSRAYGHAPQLATGVGMVRRFQDDVKRLVRRQRPRWWGRRIAFVTGSLFSPVLDRALGALARRWGPSGKVIPVENRFFGSSVTVAGLLAGADIAEALQGVEADAVVIPLDACPPSTSRFIDDIDLDDLQARARVPVVAAELLSEAVEELGALSR